MIGLRRFLIYMTMSLPFFHGNAMLIDKTFERYVDSIKNISDTLVYSQFALPTISTESYKGKCVPGEYFRPGYSVEMPACSIYYPYNQVKQRHAFILNEGGAIIINFTNSFDNYANDSIEMICISKNDAITKLEGLRDQLDHDLEFLYDEPYGSYGKMNLESNCENFKEQWYDEFKYTTHYLQKKCINCLKTGKRLGPTIISE